MQTLRIAGAVLLLAAWARGQEETATVMPREIRDLLANPGMGWQTFHEFADRDRNLAGLPSASAYFRFYWREVEPEEGKLDFGKFDDLLARARKAGQKLAFRIMCAGTDKEYLHVPTWLKDKGCKGFEYQFQGRGSLHWVPDMEDPIFQEAHFRLIADLGRRYDGHPDVDLVDIGSVGLWGEWHMSNTEVKLPSSRTRLKIIDAWRSAFPRTPKAMLIGDEEGLRHAVRNGCGWRADCLGDMGGFSKNWNHMTHFYRQQLDRTGAGEAWKTAPVAWESCWDMRKWKSEGWDIRGILDYGLDLHGSYLNNKSAPLAEGTREEVERFLTKLGYRLVLRKMEHAASAASGTAVVVSMAWENVGVAPPYRDWRVAFRLEDAGGKVAWVSPATPSIRGWLPAPRDLQERLDLPAGLAAGRYTLALAVVDPASKEPAVRLAIAGRREDGWYPLSAIRVR